MGAPESAQLLDRDSSEWTWSLSRNQAINAAPRLQHVACLMTSNLNILDQYALCLQGTASIVLELTVGRHDFPSAAMESFAPVLRVCRASVHILAVCGHASASGRDGYNSLIVSGVVVEPGFSRTVDHTYHSRCPVTLRITLGTGAALAVMHSLEWDRQRLCGSPAPLTRHGCVGKVQDPGEVFYPMDGETRNLVQSVVFRRIRHSDGCYAIP